MSDVRSGPVNTYRLQFNQRFRFVNAHGLLPYLADLGITDCYSSPTLHATPGSRHGYDICDHGRLNPELGTQEEYAAWCAALQESGFGHIVDVVPNHMSCDSTTNPWWRDVLENGPSSPYATYFDVDWDPVKPELKGKVLLTLLGDQYGRVLERGKLRLRFEDGALRLGYFDRDLPINPRQSPRVLGLNIDQLKERLHGDPSLREYLSILTALQNLPAYTEQDATRMVERQREKEVARERLVRLVAESLAIKEHIDASVREANGIPGERDSFDGLHLLLEHQAYRLAYWRTAVDDINYRRFFDKRARRAADGRTGGIRSDPPSALPAGCIGAGHRAPHRPSRRAVRSCRVLPAPAADGEPGAGGHRWAAPCGGREGPLDRRVTSRHLVAFARDHASGTLVAAVPRLVASLTGDAHPLPLGDRTWNSTRLLLPGTLTAGHYRHLITGESIRPVREPDRSAVPVADLFRTSPVALLWAPRSGS